MLSFLQNPANLPQINPQFFLKIRFGLKARIGLYERVAAFLEADIDLLNTLKAIRDRYKKNKDYRADIINAWIEIMTQGGKFADAIRPWVPPAEHMLIAAGERGEGLIDGLREAIVLSNAASENKGAIIAGVVMPIVLMVMIYLVLVGFQWQMVPTFKNMLPIEEWNSNAQYMYYLSKFCFDFWWLLLAVIAATVAIISSTIGTWTGPVRNMFDRFPPWSLYKSYQGSSFLISLSSLMKAGVPNFEALKVMRRTSSPWMSQHLDMMMSAMKLGGTNQGEALDTGLLDKETSGDVQDYSRLGSFQDAVYLLGERSLKDGVKKIKDRMAAVRNILLVVVFGCVLEIYSVTFDLKGQISDNIQNHNTKTNPIHR